MNNRLKDDLARILVGYGNGMNSAQTVDALMQAIDAHALMSGPPKVAGYTTQPDAIEAMREPNDEMIERDKVAVNEKGWPIVDEDHPENVVATLREQASYVAKLGDENKWTYVVLKIGANTIEHLMGKLAK